MAVFEAEPAKAKIPSEKKIKLGTSYQIAANGAKFHSNDTSIAYVDKEGRVTAKQLGKTKIRIKIGETTKYQKVNVVVNGKKTRKINVSTGEISVISNDISFRTLSVQNNTDGLTENDNEPVQEMLEFTLRVKLKNVGENTAKKVFLYGSLGDQTYKLNYGSMAGEQTKMVTLSKLVEPSVVEQGDQFILEKLVVYSNKMYTSYDYEEKETTLHYGTKDKKAPVISGFVGKNSYNGKMPYMVIYSDDKDYDYFRYVSAEDDREGKVKLTVNTKNVNFKKAGIYRITYTAVDKAGNTSKKTAKIEVRKAKRVDHYADEVLSRITKSNWSVYRKATAIYNYTRHHISYTGYSNKSSWEKEAIHGLRTGRGDCFTYYAVARALLTRAGIPNIVVKRYRGAGHHWWNMIYVKGGWYHYDCGPRNGGGRFCMLTDAQLKQYSRTHGNKYIWNYSAIPKSPKKRLTTIF